MKLPRIAQTPHFSVAKASASRRPRRDGRSDGKNQGMPRQSSARDTGMDGGKIRSDVWTREGKAFVDGIELLIEVMSTANPTSLMLVFAFGTLFGSFVNVCIGRLPVCKSIVWPGSACGDCGVPLAWWQNIPIVSYVALRARCYWCGSHIGIRYLLLEVLTGFVAVAVFWSTHDEMALLRYGVAGATLLFVYGFAFCCFLIIVFFVDLDAWIILDEVNYVGIAFGIVGAWAMPPAFGVLSYYNELAWGLGAPLPAGRWGNVAWSLEGAVLGFALFFAIALLGSLLARQEAMGQGDVKFAALIGAFLGPQRGLLALLLSFPLGALFALPMVLMRGKSGKTPLPFGTFMAVAAFLVVVGGAWLPRLFPVLPP